MQGIKSLFILLLIFIILFSSVNVFGVSYDFTNTGIQANLSNKSISLATMKKTAVSSKKSAPAPITKKASYINKEQAIEIAKKFFKDPDKFKLDYSGFLPVGNGSYIWNIQFRSGGPVTTFHIDARNGAIKNVYYSYNDNYNSQQVRIFKVMRKDALNIAKKEIGRLFNIDMSQYQIEPYDMNNYVIFSGGTFNYNNHHFIFQRLINGIPFSNDSLDLIVSPITGEIMGLQINNTYDSLKADNPKLSESNLPKPEGVQSPDFILEKYKSATQLQFQYIINNHQKICPVYRPYTAASYLGAFTGKYVDKTGKDMTDEQVQKSLTYTLPIALNPKADISYLKLTREDADKIADLFRITIDNMFKIKLKFTYASEGFAYTYNWIYSDSKSGTYDVTISYNPNTSHINNLHISRKKPGKTSSKISWEKAKVKALEYIKKIIPVQYGFFEDNNKVKPNINADETSYKFNFTRLVKGSRFNNNYAYIFINKATGELDNFNFRWDDDYFIEAQNKLISSRQAFGIFMNKKQATLVYQPFDIVNSGKSSEKTIRLLYKVDWVPEYQNSFGIDALSGEPLNNNGTSLYKPQKFLENFYNEHEQGKTMELLMEQGILKRWDIPVDEKITRGEAFKMFLASIINTPVYKNQVRYDPSVFIDFSSSGEYASIIEQVFSMNIISPSEKFLRINDPITKGEFVKYLTNSLGMRDMKKRPELYTIPKDIVNTNIDGDTKASIAICIQLGILPVKAGEAFIPDDTMTWDEFCTSLYNSLEQVKY